MTFVLAKQGDTVHVTVAGTLNVNNRQEFKLLLLDEIARGRQQFRIDFRKTNYIDSSGLGVLVSLAKAARSRGGELRIANLNADLRTLFELTKLDTMFRIETDEGDSPAGQSARAPTPPPGAR